MVNFYVVNITKYFKPAGLVPDVSSIVSVLVGVAYVLASVVFLFMLIWGAFNFIMAGGNSENYKHAQGQIKTAVLGIIIIALSYAIIKFVSYILNINIPI